MSAQPDTITGLGAESARELTRKIRVGLEGTYSLIIEAFKGRAWQPMGYTTWDAYCQSEFGQLALQPPRQDRQQVIMSMREAGMSVRAIGIATSLDPSTVSRQLRATSGVANATPVTGLDGKTYSTIGATTEETASDPTAPNGAVGENAVAPPFIDVPLDDVLLDMDGDDLGIEVKSERPPARIFDKPKGIVFPGSTAAPNVSSKPASPRVTPIPADVQGELFSIDELHKASKSLLLTSNQVFETKIDVDQISSEDKSRLCGELTDVLEKLNSFLDRLMQ